MIESPGDFDESVRLLEAGDATAAARLLEAITLREPDNGRAFQYLGVARSQSGDLAGGAEALRKAAAALPDRSVVWFNLGVALTRIGEAAEAQSALERAVSIDPYNAKAQAALTALRPRPVVASQPTSFVPEPPSIAPQLRPAGPIYDAPRPVPGDASGNWANQAANGPVGVRYSPSQALGLQMQRGEPSTGLRIMRGLGWGFVCGQLWTALNTFWTLVYGGVSEGFGGMAFLVAVFAVVFGIAGSIAGLIMGAIGADIKTGSIIGIVFGLLLFALEFFLNGAKMSGLFNAFFWFFTGRTVGAMIASRIQRRS